MESKRKSNSVVMVQQTGPGLLVFEVLGAGSVTFDATKAHQDNREQAEMHGWKQRLSDRAAKPRDTETGQSASPQEKKASIQELADHYMSGSPEWSLAGRGGSGLSLTIEAIARVKGVDYETAEGSVAAYAEKSHSGDTKAALAYLRTGKRVMEAMAAIRAERAPAAKIDADKALGELGQDVQ